MDDVPAVLVVEQVPQVQVMAETAEIPLVQFLDKVSQLPSDVQAPTMQVVEKTVEDTQLQIVVEKTTDDPTAAAQHQSTRQHNNYHSKQAMQQRERKEEKGLGEREGKKGLRRDQEGRRNEAGEAEVKKDVTGWTVVTRNRRQRKMVQIFVKVNGSKATPMEVNLTDEKVEDVMRQIQKDEDVYVTMHGKVLRRDEKLNSYEVTDGCTIQVTSRLRGGGKHKDKRSKADTKQGIDEWTEGPTSRVIDRQVSRSDTGPEGRNDPTV